LHSARGSLSRRRTLFGYLPGRHRRRSPLVSLATTMASLLGYIAFVFTVTVVAIVY
jgi:hypothetical protein